MGIPIHVLFIKITRDQFFILKADIIFAVCNVVGKFDVMVGIAKSTYIQKIVTHYTVHAKTAFE